ncbi:hypothetical protein OSB04_018335 [Centaurea solstitialis]|uniref:PB1 domain-containing protein n=1 Tax=Centaurea solstitialis TaxID=347529 RepID=A0AA38TGG0_9ASTR|nr:hypothetical protein OSB04_018335 [Centaurea solstitialis]
MTHYPASSWRPIRPSNFPKSDPLNSSSDMDPTAPPPPPSATTATAATNHFHSADSNTDTWSEHSSVYQSNYGSSSSAPAPPAIKLRLMCSYGGHIIPRPHDKSLCYVGGETHMVAVDRHTTLSDLTNRLSKTILRSSSTSPATSPALGFTLKYQLPSEDLDSLISVTTDEDLENMIEEYERLNSLSKSSRLRLFIFPAKPESVTSIGSFLENSVKSEDWFMNALNGTTSGFSDTSSVNNLLGLDDEIAAPEKKEVVVNSNQKVFLGSNLKGNGNNGGNNLGQDVHSIPDSPMMETTSSFGSASSTPSQANVPAVGANVGDDVPKVGGIEERFSEMCMMHRHNDAVPVAVSGSPVAIAEQSDPFLMYNERSEQGLQMAYQKQQQQQQQFQQKQSGVSGLSDMSYQEAVVQLQSSTTTAIHTNRRSTAAVPPPPPASFRVVPVASYYPMYQPPAMDQQNFVYYMPTGQQQQQQQPPQGYNFPLQQQQQPPQGYNFPLQQQHADSSPRAQPPPSTATRTVQAAPKTELPVGVYRTTNSGGPQLVQVASGHQHQPQYVGFHHPSQSVAAAGGGSGGGGNFGYEFADSMQQGQRMYYATQPMQPQSAAQYQTQPMQPQSAAQYQTQPMQPQSAAQYQTQPIQPQSAAQYQPASPVEGSSQQSSNNR